MNVNEYLQRIGYNGDRKTTLNVLQNLCAAHMYTVPFENIEIVSGRQIQYNLESIFNKVVKEKKGGICYELNTLFYWLLKTIGFEVTILQGQIYIDHIDTYKDKFSHLTLQVEIEKTKYLADVGYSGFGFIYPLQLCLRREQIQTNGTYRIKELGNSSYVVERKRKNYLDSTGERCFATDNPKYFAGSSSHRVDGWDIMYKLTTDSYNMSDFSDTLERRHANSDDFLRQNFLCLLHSERGFMGVWGDMFVQKYYYAHDDNDSDNMTCKVTTVRMEPSKGVRGVVKSKFGLNLPRNFVAKFRDRKDRIEVVY